MLPHYQELKKLHSRPEELQQGNHAYPVIFWTHPEILWILTGNPHLSFENTWTCSSTETKLQLKFFCASGNTFTGHALLPTISSLIFTWTLLLFLLLFSSQLIFYSVVLSLLFYCQCSFKNAATDKNLTSLPSFLNAFWTWLGVSYEKEVKNCCVIDKDELYSSWLYFKLQVYHRSLILLN